VSVKPLAWQLNEKIHTIRQNRRAGSASAAGIGCGSARSRGGEASIHTDQLGQGSNDKPEQIGAARVGSEEIRGAGRRRGSPVDGFVHGGAPAAHASSEQGEKPAAASRGGGLSALLLGSHIAGDLLGSEGSFHRAPERARE
jgi:hypothetical protein